MGEDWIEKTNIYERQSYIWQFPVSWILCGSVRDSVSQESLSATPALQHDFQQVEPPSNNRTFSAETKYKTYANVHCLTCKKIFGREFQMEIISWSHFHLDKNSDKIVPIKHTNTRKPCFGVSLQFYHTCSPCQFSFLFLHFTNLCFTKHYSVYIYVSCSGEHDFFGCTIWNVVICSALAESIQEIFNMIWAHYSCQTQLQSYSLSIHSELKWQAMGNLSLFNIHIGTVKQFNY